MAGDEWTVLRAIGRHLHETCVVPDEGLGETYLAVQPDGTVDRVLLAEGDAGELRIVRRQASVKVPIPA